MAELTGYRPKAILELYDDEQMFNVLAIADFHPEQAVYLWHKAAEIQEGQKPHPRIHRIA